MKTNQQIPVSKHFRIQPLDHGVYAVIHIGGGSAIGNAGIIDLGDRTLVYDSLFSPQAGKDLRSAAEILTGRPVDVVINSHYHNDHIWGNQVFSSDTDIISTVETRRLIITTKGDDDFELDKQNAESDLRSTKAAFQAAKNEGERRQCAMWLDYDQSLVNTMPILQVRPPNITFTDCIAFHGTERSAELIAFTEGHTRSDAVLFLRQEGIAFMSDLLFVENHAWLGGGDPDKFLAILQGISETNLKILVPGHGPVGGPDSILHMSHYIHSLDELACKMVEDGETEETIDKMAIPEPYNDWLLAAFFPLNMHFLYQRKLAK